MPSTSTVSKSAFFHYEYATVLSWRQKKKYRSSRSLSRVSTISSFFERFSLYAEPANPLVNTPCSATWTTNDNPGSNAGSRRCPQRWYRIFGRFSTPVRLPVTGFHLFNQNLSSTHRFSSVQAEPQIPPTTYVGPYRKIAILFFYALET